MHKRYRLQVAIRVGVLAGLVGGAVRFVSMGEYLVAALAVGGAGGAAVSLVRYTEKTVRDLTHFLESVRYADFSRRFTSGGRGPLFEELHDAFEEVTEEFRRLRAEREEQVQYLEQIVQHLGVALIAYRDDGSVELMNGVARRLLRTGPIRNVDALERVSPELVDALVRLEAGEELMIETDVEDRSLQLDVKVSRFQLRGEAHALASIQDLRNELEEKEMEAWQELTSVLTHEIMNSVAPISSLASTAQRRLQSPGDGAADGSVEDVREAIETIERRSKSLMNFVDAYRSFTDIPSPTFEILEAQDVLDNVRRLLSTQIDQEHLSLDVHVTPPGLTLTADPDLIDQALINLALNAVQAVEKQVDARIELRAYVDPQSRPVIQVRDNGPGIPGDVQEKIFVPFFTTKDDGSGIGLSLTRQIMRLHNGTISVRSTPEEGTTFTLRF
ncbi:signal transduction histidine kinase [Salinibacter ruber]|uniref:sensor histidine kinase n=1 Tax=Salinibacter ruber TaxID=146919 RepID=UPI00216711BF|nr:ATP-binding protein [Salinibacter ruber]MCS3668288.1 signal transduction histidine kinase [Salinibacter ruber]